jgi:hypothetical protein
MPISTASSIVSSIICSSFGIVSKAFLNFGCRSVKVEGLETLLTALQEPGQSNSYGRHNESKESLLPSINQSAEKAVFGGLADDGLGRRGIVTVCNHTSVVDDPMVSFQERYNSCTSSESCHSFRYFPCNVSALSIVMYGRLEDVGYHAFQHLFPVRIATTYVSQHTLDFGR